MPEIMVTIGQDGTTKITTRGFIGAACKDATRELERALGEVVSVKHTVEFYETDNTHVRVANGQGGGL